MVSWSTAVRRSVVIRPVKYDRSSSRSLRCSSVRSMNIVRSFSGVGTGERVAEPEEVGGGAAEHELELLRPQEVPVHGVVDVDAHAAVQVLAGGDHALAALRYPEPGDGELLSGRTTGRQPPDGGDGG